LQNLFKVMNYIIPNQLDSFNIIQCSGIVLQKGKQNAAAYPAREYHNEECDKLELETEVNNWNNFRICQMCYR